MEEQRRLESWKEISDYLKRSIKTCQRWELELDLHVEGCFLPAHRSPARHEVELLNQPVDSAFFEGYHGCHGD